MDLVLELAAKASLKEELIKLNDDLIALLNQRIVMGQKHNAEKLETIEVKKSLIKDHEKIVKRRSPHIETETEYIAEVKEAIKLLLRAPRADTMPVDSVREHCQEAKEDKGSSSDGLEK